MYQTTHGGGTPANPAKRTRLLATTARDCLLMRLPLCVVFCVVLLLLRLLFLLLLLIVVVLLLLRIAAFP